MGDKKDKYKDKLDKKVKIKEKEKDVYENDYIIVKFSKTDKKIKVKIFLKDETPLYEFTDDKVDKRKLFIKLTEMEEKHTFYLTKQDFQENYTAKMKLDLLNNLAKIKESIKIESSQTINEYFINNFLEARKRYFSILEKHKELLQEYLDYNSTYTYKALGIVVIDYLNEGYNLGYMEWIYINTNGLTEIEIVEYLIELIDLALEEYNG